MDTNKGIKILRIVSLTLGILSMLLFLWTRYAKAEGTIQTEFTDFPLYFGSEYYGTSHPFNAQQYLDALALAGNYINTSNPYVVYYRYASTTTYFLVFIEYSDANHILNTNTNSLTSTTQLSHYGYTDYVRIACSNNGTVTFNSEQVAIVQQIKFSTFGTFNNGTYTLNLSDTDLFYPVGGNVQNIGNLNYTFFTTGLTEEEVGQITDVFQNTQIIADSANDTIDTLTQATARNWFQAIIDTIWNTANNLVSNFRSFFAPYFNNVTGKLGDIKDFFQTLLEKVTTIVSILQQYVANDLTAGGIAQVWETNYQQSFIYTLVNTGNSIKTALSSLGDTEPQAPVITVNLGNNTFFGQTGEYQFEFTWYENMRTAVTTFITAFWLVGLGIHLFTQIPNMIHGVSGTAHGIQNAGETAPHKN